MTITETDRAAEQMTAAATALAEARQAWYDSLPAFPMGAENCPECGADWNEYASLQKLEEGYTRWTNGNVETQHHEPFVHWSTDGWDDMSEHGEFEYVQCNPYKSDHAGCGACFQIPEDEEYD